MARRPKCLVEYGGMHEVKECARACGSHFFDPGSMRFFRSRVGGEAYADGRGGAYFVTSEQFTFRERRDPRRYTIRYYDPKRCSIETVGKFQQYGSATSAKRIAKAIAKKSKTRKRGYRMRKHEWVEFQPDDSYRRRSKYERIQGPRERTRKGFGSARYIKPRDVYRAIRELEDEEFAKRGLPKREWERSRYRPKDLDDARDYLDYLRETPGWGPGILL